MARPGGTLLRFPKKNLASARRMMYTVIAVRRARPLTSLASVGPAFAPELFPIEAQRSGFDGGKEEGRSGYGVFVALSQTTETKWSEFLLTISGCSAVVLRAVAELREAYGSCMPTQSAVARFARSK